MKVRVTQKQIKQGYTNIIKVPYCSLDYLLNYANPVYYTAGTYGWGADVYDFGSTAIVTGYAPFGNICLNREMLDWYNKKAYEINHNNELTASEIIESLELLIKQFIHDAIRD